MSPDREKPEVASSRPLPVGYYVDNFVAVLDTVVVRYRDLLSDDELAFAAGFHELPLDAKRLFVRLVSRRGPSFRRDRLDYPEIESIDGALQTLTKTGFTDAQRDAPAAELLYLGLVSELREMTGALVEPTNRRGTTKAELIELLTETDDNELRSSLDQRLDVIHPMHADEVRVYRLLFFGNLAQDWTEFVLRDIGVVRYEPYELQNELRLFPSRKSLDDNLALRDAERRLHEHLEVDDTAPALVIARQSIERGDSLDRTSRRILDRMLNSLGRHLERAGAVDAALWSFGASRRPPARERRARILAKSGRLMEAIPLCDEIARDPIDESEALFAPRFGRILRRSIDPTLAPVKRRKPRAHRLEIRPPDDVRIEEAVLAALAEQGHPGFFAENWLWKSLFGLAFWDIIFTPIAGAFQHAFQYGPLDLHTPQFRQARKQLIAKRLDDLQRETSPGKPILDRYDEKVGTASSLVSWHEGSRENLELALSHLTGEHLVAVFARMSRDLKRYRRGFPDLFVLRDDAPGFELIEVKGPGDQLRPEQIAWLAHLDENGVPASVLNVVYWHDDTIG